MKPTSAEDICNLSLDLLKQSPISSIKTPVTNTEFIMSRWYDTVRMSALRAHPWKFATKRVTLTPNLSTPPPFGFTYAYDLPNDFIRMITMGDDYLGDLKIERVLENGQLLTPSGSGGIMPNDSQNNATLFFRYVYDCTDVNKFDQCFANYFALRLALKLAAKFSISVALGRDIKALMEEAEVEAKTVNGQDSPVKRIQNSRLLTKRRGLPGGIYASKYTVFES